MEIIKAVFVSLLLTVIFTFGVVAHAGEQQAPAFKLTSLEGKKFTQDDLTDKVTLMVFWASWCGTCKHELPGIRDLQEKMKKQNFQVLAVGFADAETSIRKYITEHPRTFNFPVFYDVEDRVATQWGVRGTPTLFLIDKKGQVVLSHAGGGLLESRAFQKSLGTLIFNPS
jgi:cytochrome c biogenesis protein CcmG, thiol:disulfide interchange protein DsbE